MYAIRNVVAYHPTLLFLWGAHMNMLWITSSLWSHYLLKYSMKCEPHGCIELNTKNASCLSWQNISPLYLKLIFTLFTLKPVSPTEVALTCLQIPIVQKNIGVKYIDSKHPHLQTKVLSKSRFLSFHPIDIYKSTPSKFEYFTFYEYFEKYELYKMVHPSFQQYGKDCYVILFTKMKNW